MTVYFAKNTLLFFFTKKERKNIALKKAFLTLDIFNLVDSKVKSIFTFFFFLSYFFIT